MEVAYDFVIDQAHTPHLVEINTKPGLIGVGSDVHLRDLSDIQQGSFDAWVHPHVQALAAFLNTRAQLL